MNNQIFSPNWGLIKQDLKKLAIGAGIALLGALATYLQDAIPNIDFGVYTPIVVAFNSVLINFIRKFITSTVYIK
jgi:hypothetical protein